MMNGNHSAHEPSGMYKMSNIKESAMAGKGKHSDEKKAPSKDKGKKKAPNSYMWH